jgi:hypothetical protein
MRQGGRQRRYTEGPMFVGMLASADSSCLMRSIAPLTTTYEYDRADHQVFQVLPTPESPIEACQRSWKKTSIVPRHNVTMPDRQLSQVRFAKYSYDQATDVENRTSRSTGSIFYVLMVV